MLKKLRLISLPTVVLLWTVCGTGWAQSLHAGDVFPAVTAKALNGRTLTLPDGHAVVVIVGFTQAAGKDSAAWNARLAHDFPTLPVDDLIVLDTVPGLMRGMIGSAIRHGMTPARQAHSAVVVAEGAAWRQRLQGADLSHGVVLVVDATGHIRAIVDGIVTDSGYGKVRAALLATR